MFYRYTIAFVLVAVVAGACSGSQNEGVTPRTAASTSTDTAVSTTVDAAVSTTAEFVVPSAVATVPATTVPDVAAPPVVSAVPEVEVPPSTISASTTLAAGTSIVPQGVILPEGVPLFAPDLTVESAELVGVAVGVCRGAGVDPFGSGCAGAVWEVCYGVRSDIEEIRVALGDRWDALGSEQRDAFFRIGYTLCSAAFTAEVVELASVLAASYGGRYYRESRSIVDEERWIDDYGLFGGPTRFRGDLRDFADFRHYIETGDWTYASEITPDLNEEYGLADYVSEAAYAVIKPLLKVLGRNVRYYSLRYSSMLPAEFDAGAVIRSARQEERISEGVGISIGGLPSSPEDIRALCYDAVYAARISRNGWRDDIESCMAAAEGCVEIQGDQSERCRGMSVVAREAGLELMWQLLPAVCASSEDIVYYNPDDTCRRAAFDAYVYSGSSLKRGSVFADTEGINIREAVFYLSQPLLLYNLPQHQRTNDARYIEEY